MTEHALRRAAIQARLRAMLHDLVEHMPLDGMADMFCCQRYIHERLPIAHAPADASRLPASPEEVTLASKIRLT